MTERVLLPVNVMPSHYGLEIIPDFTTNEFLCNETILVDVQSATNEITLHSKEIHILSMTWKYTNSDKTIACDEITYNKKDCTVKFVLEESLDVGSKGEIVLKYKGEMNSDMAGFYRSNYTDAMGVKKVMASTQFEALDARRAFPCWDEPGIKATFSVTIIIPSHLTAISNMPELCTTHLGPPNENKKKVVFHITPKMNTYLLAWAIGEFDFVHGTTKGGVAIRVFSPPGRAEQGRFALDVAIRSLDFYDDFFKVPYPLPKLDMICITEFAMGAMENWGLVTYRETALMIDEKTASSQSKQRVAIVVAHELAHQWFGNLVTMSWWDGLWLNEGFAAFMEHFAVNTMEFPVDALFPDYKIWEQYTTDSYGSAQRLDSLRTSHPIIVPIKRAEEVEQVFDAISYCKGSAVVNMVAAVLGKETFQAGLQLYMSRHAYGNTETVDLWNAWSEVSGKNIAELMHAWTTVTGHPVVKVIQEEWKEDEVIFTLAQSRFLSDGSIVPEAVSQLWRIPLLFATCCGVSEEAVIMESKVQTFSVPYVTNPKAGFRPWIKINAGQKALIRVAHSDEMITRLKGGIMHHMLSSVDRSALLLDSYALAKAGLGKLETIVEVLDALVGEESSIVWSAMSGVLNGLYSLISQLETQLQPTPTDLLKNFTEFGKKLLLPMLEKVGWDPKPTDGHMDKLLRATLLGQEEVSFIDQGGSVMTWFIDWIGLLDTFAWNDVAVVGEAKRRFDAHWTDPAALPTEYKGTVYRIVLMNFGEKEYEKILASYRNTEDNQKRKYPMNTLGAALDPKLKLRTLDWAVKSGEVKLQDFFYPIGSVSSTLAGTELAWQYFKENFQTIKEMLAKASPSLMDAVIMNSTARFCTEERAMEVETFFQNNPLPSSARRISQSIEVMRTSSKMLDMMKTSKLADPSFWSNR